MKLKTIFSFIIIALIIVSATPGIGAELSYPETLKNIASDIEKLKSQYPQLNDFSINKNLNIEELSIDYEYHTHEPEKTGGWSSGVPHPNDDGVWFYIDIHDPSSTREIHTQPMMTAPMCFNDKKISMLILEGAQTKSINGEIWKILRSYGIKEYERK